MLFLCTDMHFIWKKISFANIDYTDPKAVDNVDDGCGFGRPAQEGKYCPFRVQELANCAPGKTANKFGFPEKKPCVFLKLNKVGWIIILCHVFVELRKNVCLRFLWLIWCKNEYFVLDLQLGSTSLQRNWCESTHRWVRTFSISKNARLFEGCYRFNSRFNRG